MDDILFWLVPVASVLALCFAYYFHKQMMKESEGTPQMIKIAAAVRKGAMSYLKQQYKIVGCVFLGLVILFSIMAYGFHVQNAWVPIAFLTGGFFSGLSGFLGMKTATYASARTANAARNSLNAGLRIAFRSGAVMGLVVVGLGLLDISFWYLLLNAVIPADALTPTHKLCVITTTMLTFGMGASTQALFARVGGGIYTKAADVGADLVGKVEAGIPEDAVSVVIPNAVVYIPLEELVDMAKERERLEKEKAKLAKELARSNGMLNNEKFLSKAPQAKVDEEKAKLEKYKQMMEDVENRLAQLK